ncbi:hypothetical protein DKL61_05180 [Gammaproteobacteria bacterium ESL0073]|nr:hypothetical protein DKL61_05180 [Gammaproteobacteria bacterium ESL0073]
MKIKTILFIAAFVFFITGCTFTEEVSMTPVSLPEATVGKPYRVEVTINTEGGIIGGFNAPVSPSNSGLGIDVCNPNDSTKNALSCVVIQGVPKDTTQITINISGNIIPEHGVIYKVRKVFDKTYIIQVKEAE